ncbi:MAG: nicotinamide-nucleotide amidohydrolase family protein [Gammaproteobacteria bacterium]|nr:nicotinamide-nucleotide amidohydrolase family protein [Gammaproteobacteria bacterium]
MNGINSVEQILQKLSHQLLERGWKVAAAESCTGGWIAKLLTDLPGSTAWFERGFVTYSNEAKVDMLGLSAATLQQHGAVSEATVKEMVAGALDHSHADLAVAVSGIAGPSGGSVDKPVGLVWFGWQRRDGRCHCESRQFEGGRDAVRAQTVWVALKGLSDFCET